MAKRRPISDRHHFDALGRRVHVYGVALCGRLSAAKWRKFVADVTVALRMQPAYPMKSWRYPVKGKGGTGMTVVQPITESFIALDTWPDHVGAYVYVVSCRAFQPEQVNAVAHRYGLTAGDYNGGSLAFP